ncbi:cytochrome c maturation protein CcmE [Telmatospirillum siberiense]|uniref:Cytochrome c-type biogenesis protein CcmE n=1 Tax=Telmatospirillum siberiense TaxID=382514 RepID=A0A2N3PVV5_9PROT|nr:cytochrome c maturation protein CcmE [Telmatospirillum siberiense]PKU24517.1 cytochrome c maturation protein CcmE [Telmatospirillum siberiense]
MTRKQRRLYFVLLGMVALGGAAALVLTAMNDTLVYFYTPADLQTKHVSPDRRLRIGGLVEQGSIQHQGDVVHFVVTDLTATLPVVYRGVLPDLFREGQGVVTEGKLDGQGLFHASEVLAKHDENYMPKEVAEAIKKSGQWQEEGKKP